MSTTTSWTLSRSPLFTQPMSLYTKYTSAVVLIIKDNLSGSAGNKTLSVQRSIVSFN